MAGHTTPPWTVGNYEWSIEPEGSDETIAEMDTGLPNWKYDRDFILRAVNAHDQLSAACKALAGLWHDSMEHRPGGDDAALFAFGDNCITVGDVRRARAAIAAASPPEW